MTDNNEMTIAKAIVISGKNYPARYWYGWSLEGVFAEKQKALGFIFGYNAALKKAAEIIENSESTPNPLDLIAAIEKLIVWEGEKS